MKLLDRVSDVGTRKHLAASTIECYRRWVREFLAYHCREGHWRHPAELGTAEVEAFLTALARDRQLSASSQNQAVNAIVFLYKQVLADEVEPDHLGRFAAERSRRPVRLPAVLSQHEVQQLIEIMRPQSMHRLMVELMYGTGLRVMECCTLRLRDVDFDRQQIWVRSGKGDKDRIVMLPQSLRSRLTQRLTWWYERLTHVLRICPNVRRVYAFFDNDFSGHAPTAARRFADKVNLPRFWETSSALNQPGLYPLKNA